jgi:NADH:ubiquinone oxidoreductase subunit K
MADLTHFSKADRTVFAVLVVLAIMDAGARVGFALLSTVYR